MFERLGRLVLKLRFAIVAVWALAAVVLALTAPSLSKVGSADETSFLPKDAESLAARQVIANAFASDAAPAAALIVFSRPGGLTDADRAAIEGLRSWLEGSDKPDVVLRYVTAEGTPSLAPMFRSKDGAVELARVDLSVPSFLPSTNSAIDSIRVKLAAAGTLPEGLHSQITGQAGIGRDYIQAIRDGTDRTTIVTILLVVAVLLLIYRAPLAAMVPLITIGCAFEVSRGALGFMAQGGWKLSSVLDSFIVVLVFGVGTDYTIFLVSRFREELGRNRFADAIRVTVSRMGAVIAASAATVIVGLSSMVAASFGMIQTTGPALALTIFITLLAGLSLTPSLLAIFGRRLFWPRHEATRDLTAEDKGLWAGLARRITEHPAVLAAAVLVVLAMPLLTLGGFKENFNVLQELPAEAESRIGFETLAKHLGEGQLMPLNVLVQAQGTDLSSPESLRRMGELEARIRGLANVASVSSIVDPTGEGKVSDILRPSVQLAAMADGFSKEPGTDLNVQLGDASLAGVTSSQSYVAGLDKVYPKAAGTALSGAQADLTLIQKGVVDGRAQANVATQLGTISKQLQAAALGGAGNVSPADVAKQLGQLKTYVTELGVAVPELTSTAAYQAALTDIGKLATSQDAATFLGLIGAFNQMQAWFEARPTATYFVSSAFTMTAEQAAAQQAMAAARTRLPGELRTVAALFTADDLYAPPSLVAAYESPSRDVARLYVITAASPYDTASFDTVHALRDVMAAQAPAFGSGARGYIGGPTAEFADVQTTISADFVRVAVITIVGILLVLILLLRALVAPIYLVLTVLLSFTASLTFSTFLLVHVFGQAGGVNYFIPLIIFVLLVALGSDYNIFLMSRVREESASRPFRQGIRVASARTGTVITSAGLILAGTFGALVTSPLQLLFQVGVIVGLGVLVDTFIVRSLLVPAITAVIGEWAWWPGNRRRGADDTPVSTP